MNIFERATRKKYRFASVRGDLTVEQLWDLPLKSRSSGLDRSLDLDNVARAVNSELKAATEESFVETRDPRQTDLETKLEIVKYVIASKLKDQERNEAARSRAERRRRLLAALDSKEQQALENMSREQILRELEETE